MSREEVARINDQVLAAWDSHDADALVNLLADDFLWVDLALPEPMRSKDQARQFVQGWFTAFPDITTTRRDRVLGDDAVAVEVEWTGTNSGPMAMAGTELPPTGKSVLGRGAYFARVKEGKIVQFNSYPDLAGLMMQLGLMPGT